MVTIWEVLDRVEEGPVCKETDFDLNIFSATVNKLVREHDLKCTPEEPIPNDNTLADEVFEGLDESGEAAVFDLVRTKAEEGKSIYIITHSPHIDSLYSSTMTAVADKTGATKIQ